MFGKNKVLNPHEYDQDPEGSLRVTTIFPTIQGEGPFSGCPATFVRLSGCNLACSFCDTYFDAGEVMPFAAIMQTVRAGWKAFRALHGVPIFYGQHPLLVLTGGEPMMQRNVVKFIQHAEMSGFTVQIETNGIFYRELPPSVSLVVSPKVNERTREYIKPDDRILEKALALKFVVSADVPGYDTIPEFAKLWLIRKGKEGKEIFISPMNCYSTQPAPPPDGASLADRVKQGGKVSFWDAGVLDMERNRKNHEYAATLCMKLGLRLSLQTHLYAGLP